MAVPRPTPRNRGSSADNITFPRISNQAPPHPQPVPRPRIRTSSSTGSDNIIQEAEEDIYTDNQTAGNQIFGEIIVSKPHKGILRNATSPVVSGGTEGSTQSGNDLRRWEDRLRARESDNEFAFTERERNIQQREDQVHMKEKDLKHKEFDLSMADSPPQENAGERLASLASRDMELDRRAKDLDLRGNQLDEKERQLQQWEKQLMERAGGVDHHGSATHDQQRRSHGNYTQPQPVQYSHPQFVAQSPQYTQTITSQQQHSVPYRSPEDYAPVAQIPTEQPLPPRPSQLPAPIYTPKPVVSVDEEIAIMLQRTETFQTQIDEDAEIARLLQEQEEKELSANVDLDQLIALSMQHDVLNKESGLAANNELTDDGTTGTSGSAQEIIQRRLQEQLTINREREEQDRKLAEQLSREGQGETTPDINDLDS